MNTFSVNDGNTTSRENVASKEGTIQRKHSDNQRMSKGSVKPYLWFKVFRYKITNNNIAVE